MHIRHLPLAFFTMTPLVSQVEYMTSLMKFALRSLLTFSLTALHHSSPILIFFCDIGLAWGQMASLWQIMLGWMLSMSDGYQENKSAFLYSMSVMLWCLWLVRSLLSCIHCLGLGPSCTLTSSSMGFRPLPEVLSCGSMLNSLSRLA